jgi:TonB-linked SusC/RagA family outer membrane protein
VNINLKSSSLFDVFKEIEKQSEYRFFYHNQQIDVSNRIDVVANNTKISDILENIFKNTNIAYKVMDKHIVLVTIPGMETYESTIPTNVFIQTLSISGVITDSKGNSLPGVYIKIKGTTQGVVTDINGKFTLIIPSAQTVLQVSCMGYISQELYVGTQKSLKIIMQEDVRNLDEVVVVGYGTQRKSDVTSSVSSVKSDKFLKGSAKDAAQLIQGKVSGLTVSTSSGDPTEGTQIMLRGISTLLASSSPLVLVDGIPGSLTTVAPEDIESIDVLKDGSAAAIYGTRGTNGVILITTKKATNEMKPTMEYSSYVSTQIIARKMDFLTASDYRRLIKQGVGFENLGGSTDWLKEITRTPISQTHNLTLQGGNSTSNYTASVNYRGWEGIFKRSDNNQLIGRIDLNHSMFDNKLKFNLSSSYRDDKYWAGGDGYSFNTGVYRQAIIRNPTDVVKNADGSWKETDTYMYDNPVGLLMETDGLNEEKEIRVAGSAILSPIKDLNIKLLVSQNSDDALRGFYQTKKNVSTTKYGKNGYASRSTSDTKDNLLEFTTDYSKSIGKHRASILGGYSYQDQTNESFWMQNWDFPTDLYSYNNMATGDALSRGEALMGSNKNSSKLIGFFGRLNYNYDDKYLLMASIRREGSTKFGANYQWGNFPAISAGWRISKESFMQSLDFIENLKIRAGYGITGTEPSSPYMSQISLNYGDRFLDNGKWIQGITPVRNANPNLRWEKKKELNLGLDFSFLKGRISGNVDVYQRKTVDMLYDYSVPVPPNLYSTTTANVGVMENKGVETYIQFIPLKTQNFNWTSSFTYSTNTNKLVSLSNDQFKMTNNFFDTGYTGEPIQTTTHRVEVGGPIGNFWGFKSIGISSDGIWIIQGKDGKPKSIADASDDDKQVLGNGLPKYYIGFNNAFQYKNFDLTINLRGAFGFQILNFQRMFYENPKVTQYNMLKSAFDKVYGKAVLNSDLAFVSYYIENGNYLKIDNVTLGYTFNLKNVKFIKNAKVYVSGLNLLTITGYKGIDPEVNRSGLNPGDDERDKYPTTRTFTLGVNITF